MQPIDAYLISMLTAVEVGLSIIAAGVLSIGFYAAASWVRARVEQSGKPLRHAAIAGYARQSSGWAISSQARRA